jgi:hypothetical protein
MDYTKLDFFMTYWWLWLILALLLWVSGLLIKKSELSIILVLSALIPGLFFVLSLLMNMAKYMIDYARR